MKTSTPSTINNAPTAMKATNTSPISQVQGERRTQDAPLPPNSNSIFSHNITNVDTLQPVQLTNDQVRLETVLHHLNSVLEIHKKSSPDNRDIAALLLQLGKTFRCLGDNLINNLSSLLCFASSLKICLNLVTFDISIKPRLSEIYLEIGTLYKDLKDSNKATVCFKYADLLNDPSLVKNIKKSTDVNYSYIILPFGEIDNHYINLALLKQKVQTALLDPIAYAIEKHYGWSHISLGFDWGVKGYIDRNYVKKILTGLGEKEENIEPAQMLCFEAMNLALMKHVINPSNILKGFINAYLDLIKKTEKSHPEFFVDGSIVKHYQRALSDSGIYDYQIFSDYEIFKRVDYLFPL